MKKIVIVGAALCLALCLFGCSSGASASGGSGGSTAASEPAKPVDLAGNWKQTNPNSQTTWMEGTIADGAITVYWVSNNGDTKSLYWAGTYVAPTEAGNSWTWDSANDTSKTKTAMMASSSDTKTFKYENGTLSFEVTALGNTTTVKMAKQ